MQKFVKIRAENLRASHTKTFPQMNHRTYFKPHDDSSRKAKFIFDDTADDKVNYPLRFRQPFNMNSLRGEI